MVDREIRQGELVLGQPDLGAGVDRPEQGDALDPGPDGTLEVARHPVGLGQRVEQGGATAVVEVRAERACLLEQGDRGPRLTAVRHDRCEGDQDADPQLRVRLGSELGEELLVEHPGPSRVVGRVVAGREPVRRPARLRGPVCGDEELPCLCREPDHLPALPEPVGRLGEAQERETAPGALDLRLEDRPEAIGGGLPVAGGEPELGVDPLPLRVRVGEEGLRRGPEAPCQVAKGRERRLDQALLERADVGLRIARLGELPLGHPRLRPGCLQPRPDLSCEVPILLGEARAAPDPLLDRHRRIIATAQSRVDAFTAPRRPRSRSRATPDAGAVNKYLRKCGCSLR